MIKSDVEALELDPAFWKMIFEFARKMMFDPENGDMIRANWKINYDKYIQSLPWKEKAKQAKEHAGNRCQLCNSPDNLAVHHRTYERLGCELPEDLTVLCKNCHSRFHELEY